MKSKAASSAATSSDGGDYSRDQWVEVGRATPWKLALDKAIKPSLIGKYMVADLSQMNYTALKEMLAAIRSKARESGLKELPVILTCHSKYIKDFSSVESFVRDVANARDFKFATLTNIARKLRAGDFVIKTALML